MKRPCRVCGVTSTQPLCPIHRTREARGYGSAWRRLSRAVLERDGFRCAYCGGPADTTDHVLPKSLGGRDDAANLVASCRRCNSAKGNR